MVEGVGVLEGVVEGVLEGLAEDSHYREEEDEVKCLPIAPLQTAVSSTMATWPTGTERSILEWQSNDVIDVSIKNQGTRSALELQLKIATVFLPHLILCLLFC